MPSRTISSRPPRRLAKRHAAALAAAVAAFLVGCRREQGPAANVPGEVVVAEVGGQAITAADLEAEASRRAAARRPASDKTELLQELIRHEALLLRAREAGVDRDPETVREIEDLIVRRLVARDLQPLREAVSVDDDAVRAEYDAHPDRHARPAMARFAVLFRAADAKATAGRRAEARGRLEEARRGLASGSLPGAPGSARGFGRMAAELSEDQVSRYRGGDLGWVVEGQNPARIPAAVMQAGWTLEDGAFSEVLEGPDGCYLLLRTDSRPATRIPFETVAAGLRQTLLAERRRTLEETFRADVSRRFPAQIHTGALAAVQLPAAGPSLAVSNREAQPPVFSGSNDSIHGN